MILLAGTVPLKDFPLTEGKGFLKDNSIIVGDQSFPCGMGSGAMMSAVIETLEFYGKEPPYLVVAGDIGNAMGSRKIYKRAGEIILKNQPAIITMHYLQPIVTLMEKICHAASKSDKKPFMIADAGSLYAAKASGNARNFNLFTPDTAELKFLADSNAMHPAYISNYLLANSDENIPELIHQSYSSGCAPDFLLVKGKTDYIAAKGNVVHTTSSPDLPLLEPIGGTGDTITGIATALIATEVAAEKASHAATRINRLAGQRAELKPASKVTELIKNIKPVLNEINDY